MIELDREWIDFLADMHKNNFETMEEYFELTTNKLLDINTKYRKAYNELYEKYKTLLAEKEEQRDFVTDLARD
jgi:hypothetical protein